MTLAACGVKTRTLGWLSPLNYGLKNVVRAFFHVMKDNGQLRYAPRLCALNRSL